MVAVLLIVVKLLLFVVPPSLIVVPLTLIVVAVEPPHDIPTFVVGAYTLAPVLPLKQMVSALTFTLVVALRNTVLPVSLMVVPLMSRTVV